MVYEWKPSQYDNCHMIGHDSLECRKIKEKQIWVQKKVQKDIVVVNVEKRSIDKQVV